MYFRCTIGSAPRSLCLALLSSPPGFDIWEGFGRGKKKGVTDYCPCISDYLVYISRTEVFVSSAHQLTCGRSRVLVICTDVRRRILGVGTGRQKRNTHKSLSYGI